MTDKLMNTLSLCRKAGALVAGFDAVAEALQKGDGRLLLFAADLSEKTKKRMESGNVPAGVSIHTLPYTQDELALITKKPVGVLTVTDENLAKLCLGVL